MSDSASANSLRALYSSHHGWLRRWLHRRLGSADNAADLAQDAFIRLIESRTPRIVEPRAFLVTLAKRAMISFLRHQEIERAYRESVAQLPESMAPSPETRVILVETLLEIDRLLDGLPLNVKTAFLLAQLDGLSYAEIARHLDISVSSVKQYMARAYRHCYFSDVTSP